MSEMSEKTVLHSGEIRDWQVGEKSDEHLTDLQKAPWVTTVTEGPYDGLFIELTAPDGSKRSVSLEIQDGNVRLFTWGNRDEFDAIVTIQENGTHVSSNEGNAPSYVFSPAGVQPAPSKPVPAFGAEPGASPKST